MVKQVIILLFFALLACELYAEDRVWDRLKSDNRTKVNAEYWKGGQDKPAVLIAHGFLQTSQFYTVRRLATGLADEGFTVLTPTLSLGVSDRRGSLGCDDLQLHTMTQSADEIAQWVGWLQERGHEEVHIIGHSTGGTVTASLLERKQAADLPVLKGAILLSVAGWDERNVEPYLVKAREDNNQAPGVPQKYALAHCSAYLTLPAYFLDYGHWTRGRVLETIDQVDVPSTLIIGSEDHRLSDRLKVELGKRDDVRSIQGANHFFDDEFEFAVLDEVLDILNKD